MGDHNRDAANEAPLNPALKSQVETTYDTTTTTPAPIDTASASENEGEGWPVIWLVVTVVCAAVTIFLIF